MLEEYIYQKCIESGLCDKGKVLWHDKDKLMSFAKQEIEFVVEQRPLTHKEIIDFLGLEYLNKHSIYIDQDINKSVESDDIYTALLGCKGYVRLYTSNNVLMIADNSDLEVRVLNSGVLTIRLYTGSVLDLAIKRDAMVFVFNYGGSVRKIVGNTDNVVIKNLKR